MKIKWAKKVDKKTGKNVFDCKLINDKGRTKKKFTLVLGELLDGIMSEKQVTKKEVQERLESETTAKIFLECNNYKNNLDTNNLFEPGNELYKIAAPDVVCEFFKDLYSDMDIEQESELRRLYDLRC